MASSWLALASASEKTLCFGNFTATFSCICPSKECRHPIQVVPNVPVPSQFRTSVSSTSKNRSRWVLHSRAFFSSNVARGRAEPRTQ
eukprot:2770796-Amphidinium_carterae.1